MSYSEIDFELDNEVLASTHESFTMEMNSTQNFLPNQSSALDANLT